MDISICCICGCEVETKFSLLFKKLFGYSESDYVQKIAICPKCGYIFTQNPFTEDALKSRYQNNSKFEYDSDDYIFEQSVEYKDRCSEQKAFIDARVGGQYHSVFEVGAASGYNLSLYFEEGNLTYGVEPSYKNCDVAKRKYNVELFSGMFQEYIKNVEGSDKWDLLIVSMMLEHIVDPKWFIEKCRDLCNKYMFIEIPTLDYKTDEEAFGMFCEEHVSIFTIESISNLMRSCGFRLIDLRMVFGFDKYLPAGWPAIDTLWIKEEGTTVVKNALKGMFSSEELLFKYIEINKGILDRIEDVLNEINDSDEIAIWGVGHHASMLLGNTSLLQKKIVRIYDSDQRKHGIEMFDGIKITGFDPNDIIKYFIKGVLVTTYTAQTSICKILEHYKEKIKIYTLYDI